MKTYQLTVGKGTRYEMVLTAVQCGQDYSVTICGGSRHHVGAAALGCARPLYPGKPKRSASVSVLCAFEHKDDEIARRAAKVLATELDCRVSVAAGVHIDEAAVEELQVLLENCDEICRRLIEKIRSDCMA